MYSACIHCHHPLGANEAIESFPVGRRLAFDAAKGRLWVVCRKCERWNLTPLEERWEAIEACERAFGATRLRVSTDNVGLARLREGTELVRIGAPKRPEMAAWRYGDQFGRRRWKWASAAGASALSASALYAGGMLAFAGVGLAVAIPVALAQGTLASALGLTRALGPGTTVHLSGGGHVTIAAEDRPITHLVPEGSDAKLLVVASSMARRVGNDIMRDDRRRTVELRGDNVRRVLAELLPGINARGGRPGTVQRAVATLEEAPSLERVYAIVAAQAQRHYRTTTLTLHEEGALPGMPAPLRLALEMAAHEEQERRALEGELAELEEAWRRAEEVAGIADGMFVPATVEERLARLHDDVARGGAH